LAAAIEAHDAGANVLVLEKDPSSDHYSSTKMSGGSVHYAENAAEAIPYFKAMAFGIGLPSELGDPPEAYPLIPQDLVEDIAKAWGDGVCHTVDWLQSLGPIEMVISLKKSYPNFPGGAQYGTASPLATAGVVVKSGGQTLFSHLSNAVEDREIEILWETPGKRLVTGGNGEVLGVLAERQGKQIAVKARKGVVLATGGFQYDEELRKSFLPGWKWAFLASPSSTGDGLRMAMSAGAALRRMTHTVGRPTAGAMVGEVGTGVNIPSNSPGRTVVDNYGRRYFNEDWTMVDPPRYNFNPVMTQFDPLKLEYPRIPSWVIFDEKVRLAGPVIATFYGVHAVGLYQWSDDNSAEISKGWILKGDSISDLADKIKMHQDNKGRMSAEILGQTVDKFNNFCVAGNDADFGRSAETLGPLDEPPYYAVATYPGAYLGGGPIRNANAQIVNIFGGAIPRLYSAGELGSWFAFVYTAGAYLAECIISGRIAGKNAAAETPWS
jgi:hypothetical protein